MTPNTQFATTFINSLAASGLRHVCIAPGSRSTPLTLAFDAHPDIELILHLDERSAGFFALGLALATDNPVALVCTSGTAAANFYPAIIEAMMSHIPLIVLTADRPHELRHSGANQTIDQVKLFGDNVLWSVDAPLPTKEVPAVVHRQMHTLAARAFATANGIRKGPVHINLPFRKPLEPESGEWVLESGSFSVKEEGLESADKVGKLPMPMPQSPISVGTLSPTEGQTAWLTAVIQRHPRGLIVCGPRCPGGAFPAAVANLSRQIGYPILADPISGLRYGSWVADTAVISTFETMTQHSVGMAEPDVIIRFGALPISKWLNTYLEKNKARHRIHIRANGIWADDSHQINAFLQADETAVCQQLIARLDQGGQKEKGGDEWVKSWMDAETKIRRQLATAVAEAEFDGGVVADVLAGVPADSLLFMGNSLPIRHLDQYGLASQKAVQAYANRGASGIDGTISTALGMHLGSGKKLVLVLGDITFYHDMNGLLAIKQLANEQTVDITIVLLNNDGGGIFNRLPVSKFEPPFNKLFITPHSLDFEPAAQMYGLKYFQIEVNENLNGRAQFRTFFAESMAGSTPRIIEVKTNGKTDDQIRRHINQLAGKK